MEKALLCECERVTIAEFEQVASEPTSHSHGHHPPHRMGMGTCQGSFCGAAWARCSSQAAARQDACGTGEVRRPPAAADE